MRFGQLCGLALIGLAMAGCATGSSFDAVDAIRFDAPDIAVTVPAYSSRSLTDGRYCEYYQISRVYAGVTRRGTATVCRHTGQPWVLVARTFDQIGSQMPVGSTPVPPTSTPVVIQPAPPPPPAGGSGTGGWQPVTQ